MNRYLLLFGCALLFSSAALVVEGDTSDETTQATEAHRGAENKPAPAKAQAPPELTPRQQLAQIELPDNPSRQKVEAYVAALEQLMADANLLKEEPIALVLELAKDIADIPPADIQLILERLDIDTDLDRFRKNAISKHDPELYQPLVIAGLDEHPNNIIAIRLHGWYDDAKEPILRKLEKLEPLEGMKFGNAWLHAFTHVAEPKHYPMVKQAFVSSHRRSQQALMLETMPGYDILDTIKACIAATNKNIADGNPAKRYIDQEYRGLERLWVLAAREGDLDSLGILIDTLHAPKEYSLFWCYGNNEMDIHRDYVTQFIDFKGSNKAIAEWFKVNRDKLAFDSLRKRFVFEEEF